MRPVHFAAILMLVLSATVTQTNAQCRGGRSGQSSLATGSGSIQPLLTTSSLGLASPAAVLSSLYNPYAPNLAAQYQAAQLAQ